MSAQDDAPPPARDIMTFTFDIPGPTAATSLSVNAGASLVFVGANGGGKTRLAVFIEDAVGEAAHRISAHRALTLNPDVAKISERKALAGLRTGHPDEGARIKHRRGSRWQGKAAVVLLNDFDYLIQALFAEQTNTSLETHRKNRASDLARAGPTKFEQLAVIWQRLLPHRELHITGDNIEVSVASSLDRYPAGDMSDGERSIFYMIGQALLADEHSLLIIDEPELHVHRSIMSKLWDELEAARPDCAFVFITHDLDFAAARLAQKFSIEDYQPTPWWKLKSIPPETGFDEATATLILGSRVPVLFVEGAKTSLDNSIYRCCFPAWTVIPRGSCEEVIHAVTTMRANKDLTRITCAGLVDADDFTANEKAFMAERGIAILPVSEIENLLLLPSISRTIAESEGHVGAELQACLDGLAAAVFGSVSAELIEDAVVRHSKRRVDRYFKRIEFGDAATVADLIAHIQQQTTALDISAIADDARAQLAKAVANGDLAALLARFDNKGLLAMAATHLKRTKVKHFQNWLTRVLLNDKAPTVLAAIRAALPPLKAS